MLCGIRVRWLLLGLLFCMPAAHAIEPVAVTALPVEVRDTMQLIRQGGPFPYARDGAVFHNYEHRLPALPRGCTSDRAKGSLHSSGGPIGLPLAGTLLTKSADCGRRCEAGAPAPKGSASPCRARYHEYTVRTPGVNNRGARRIVCGPLPECYYTGDHYRTFRRITGVY